MADTHTKIDEEFEVILKVKVKLTQANYYGDRTKEQLKSEVDRVKNKMKDHLLSKIEGEFYGEEKLGDDLFGYITYNYEITRK
jgi:hypothetical protein